ncbi:hypothetical protein EBU71_18815 [bacterium]|nr:hypothetical protein [Candidatus Elulimicrobium humile]
MAQTHIQNVQCGDKVQISWVVTNDNGKEFYHWYAATVKKIHRYDQKYVVCHIVYDDGDENKSQLLWEKDYNVCWRFVEDDYDSEEFEEVEVVRERGLTISVNDNEAVAAHLLSIKSSLRKLSVMYLITHVPLWFSLYSKYWDHIKLYAPLLYDTCKEYFTQVF